jgi:hypothetical protein
MVGPTLMYDLFCIVEVYLRYVEYMFMFMFIV